MRSLLILLYSFSLIAGDPWCDCPQPGTYPSTPELDKQYEEAIADARVPKQSAIYKDLRPIIPGRSGIFNDKGEILMVTWSKCNYYNSADQAPGKTFKLYGDTWFSIAPEMQEWCSQEKAQDLRLRIAQRLGMNPTSNNNRFVEVWVDPALIFRPCPDPEIYDSQCVVQVPMQPDDPGAADTPWADPQVQLSEAFMNVNEDHLEWIYQWWNRSYSGCTGNNCFPWTALGYTYDWGPDNKDNVGGSEYVVLGGSPVTMKGMTSIDAYCGRTSSDEKTTK